MEEKRQSLPEVVTVRKRPRIPGVTLNRLSDSFTIVRSPLFKMWCVAKFERLPLSMLHESTNFNLSTVAE